jgi:hypothetical protein
MPLAENRTYWPHANPTAAADHLADHNAMAALLNAGLSSGLVKQPGHRQRGPHRQPPLRKSLPFRSRSTRSSPRSVSPG